MGNRIARVEPNHRALGTRVHYIYERNRLAQIDYPTKQDVTYKYGMPGAPTYGAGRVTSIADESGTKNFEYGAMGEVVRTTRTVIDSTVTPPTTTTFDVHAAYDSLGQQLQLVYPDGELVSNQYDLAGRLTKVVGTGNGWSRTYASNFRYNELGDKTGVQYGNGVRSSWSYDPLRARLSTLQTVQGATKLQDLAYTYDQVGNPKTIANNLPASPVDNSRPGTSTQSYVYDGADQLVSATGSGTLGNSLTSAFTMVFDYSPSRNITFKKSKNVVKDSANHPTLPVDSNYSSTYSYAGAPHLPSAIGGTTLTYDPSGNPVQRSSTAGIQRLTWDDDNRLAQVQGWGANQRNLYDASGTRVVRNGADHTIFVDNLFEFNTVATGTKHIYAAGAHIASAPSAFASGVNPALPTSQGAVFYVHQSHLGSVGVVTTSTGTVNDAHEYFPDGAAWIDSGIAHTVDGILFNAKPFDSDTKLYDFGQRFYDPKFSLWLGNDPDLRSNPGSAIGRSFVMSPAAYAGQNPIRYRDPDGRTIIEGLKPEVSDDEKLKVAAYEVAQEVLNELGSSVQDVQDACNVQARLERGDSRGGEPALQSGYSFLNRIPGVGQANQIWDAADHYIGGKRDNTSSGDPLEDLRNAAIPDAPSAPAPPSFGKTGGWHVGDDHNAPTYKGTPPAWSTTRGRYWKNKASDPAAAEIHGPENTARMKTGRAPQRVNKAAPRGIESKELSHEPIPQRNGGKEFVERWPQDHAAVDPYRKPGY